MKTLVITLISICGLALGEVRAQNKPDYEIQIQDYINKGFAKEQEKDWSQSWVYFQHANQKATAYNKYSNTVWVEHSGEYYIDLSRKGMKEAEKKLQPSVGRFIDNRDGNTYTTLTYSNGQTWLGENMAYLGAGGKYYKNDRSNLNSYGALYSWKEAQQVCPSGWRLPSFEDIESFMLIWDIPEDREFHLGFGYDEFCHQFLIPKGKSGFYNVAPGILSYQNIGRQPVFMNIDSEFSIWTSSESRKSGYTPIRYGQDFNMYHQHLSINEKSQGLSCRCLKND